MIGCFAGFVIDEKVVLAGLSLAVALFSLLILRKASLSTRAKLGLIYFHLSALIFTPVLLTTQMGCASACMQCGTDLAQLTVIALPTTLLLSGLAGFVAIPGFFLWTNRNRRIGGWPSAFASAKARKLGIRAPRIYALDKAEPIAFSFRTWRSAIFLSVGLTEILNKKELQAVLLHELAHIASKASLLKVSTSLLRFSPLALLKSFYHDVNSEERAADRFAIKSQKTSRWLNSAKRKIVATTRF